MSKIELKNSYTKDGVVVETHKIICIKNGQEKNACIELSKNQYHVGITFSLDNLQLKKAGGKLF